MISPGAKEAQENAWQADGADGADGTNRGGVATHDRFLPGTAHAQVLLWNLACIVHAIEEFGVEAEFSPRAGDAVRLTDKEQRHVRTALRFLRYRVGGWQPLADALGLKADTLGKVLRGGRGLWRRCSSTWV